MTALLVLILLVPAVLVAVCVPMAPGYFAFRWAGRWDDKREHAPWKVFVVMATATVVWLAPFAVIAWFMLGPSEPLCPLC